MDSKKQSRREFLSTTQSVLGGSWIALHLPAILATATYACRAKNENADFEILTPFEVTELEAIAEQIFPTDETPGARDASVIYFIDHALGTFSSGDLDPVRDGLHEIESSIRKKHPGTDAFSKLASEQQIEALREIDTTDFFETVRNLTIAGMFSHPSYGGNREKIGWQLLQFDDKHAWQPPFG
ncbi:MAG: gluconate 2-dehydrogenase subunit 3 family protein, partial [bacterium]